jgi:hypothetical protein
MLVLGYFEISSFDLECFAQNLRIRNFLLTFDTRRRSLKLLLKMFYINCFPNSHWRKQRKLAEFVECFFYLFFWRICITRTKTYFPANCVRAKLILGVNILHSWRLRLQLNIKDVNAGRKLIFRTGTFPEICISFLHIWLHEVLNSIVRLNGNTVKIQNHVICLFNGEKNFV